MKPPDPIVTNEERQMLLRRDDSAARGHRLLRRLLFSSIGLFWGQLFKTVATWLRSVVH
jgi:hypothetical protein